MVQWVGKWERQEVGLDPYTGFDQVDLDPYTGFGQVDLDPYTGFDQVDFDPYTGFERLGYRCMRATTRRVVWMVLL